MMTMIVPNSMYLKLLSEYILNLTTKLLKYARHVD